MLLYCNNVSKFPMVNFKLDTMIVCYEKNESLSSKKCILAALICVVDGRL